MKIFFLLLFMSSSVSMAATELSLPEFQDKLVKEWKNCALVAEHPFTKDDLPKYTRTFQATDSRLVFHHTQKLNGKKDFPQDLLCLQLDPYKNLLKSFIVQKNVRDWEQSGGPLLKGFLIALRAHLTLINTMKLN